MASQTQNYHYPKPEEEDFYDVGEFNRAMDMIDEDIKQVEEAIPAAVRVKGAAESSYRTGDVNITPENIGLGNVPNVSTNNQTPTFTQASGRVNIGSGERLSVIFGKIMKWFADLKTVAFSGKYTDLTDKPTIPAAVRVKGNAESTYRTGNVNLTAANIGAVSKSGDTITGRLSFINSADLRFIPPDITGDHARGMFFMDKSGTGLWGGIGALGTAGELQCIYIGAGTPYPWGPTDGLRISDTYIKWKNSNLVTENSGTAKAAIKATQDGNGNVIADSYAVRKIISSGSFNDITTPGLYTMRTSEVKDGPSDGSNYHGLIVLKSDNGNYVEQIAFKESSNQLYVRYINGSTKSSWEKLLTTSDLDDRFDPIPVGGVRMGLGSSPYYYLATNGISTIDSDSNMSKNNYSFPTLNKTISYGEDFLFQVGVGGVFLTDPSTNGDYAGKVTGIYHYKFTAFDNNVWASRLRLLNYIDNSNNYFYTQLSTSSSRANINVSLPTSSGTLSVSSSDVRLKNNIKDTEVTALPTINKIKFRQFDWKDKKDHIHQDIGVVADELEELDNHFVLEGTGGYIEENGEEKMNVKCVDTFYLMGYYGKAIQELSELVTRQQQEINMLKTELQKHVT